MGSGRWVGYDPKGSEGNLVASRIWKGEQMKGKNCMHGVLDL